MTFEGRGPLRKVMVEQWGRSGTVQDVDRLMAYLEPDVTFTVSRLADYGLSLVDTPEGRARIEHFLFHGNPVQRNYAALYFKRRGVMRLLDKAVRLGCIDELQAYRQ